MPVKVLLALALVFAVSRAFLACAYDAPGSDVPLYAGYAQDARDAMRSGESPYAVHAERVRTESLDLSGTIEYPPLALLLLTLPSLGAGEWDQAYRLLYMAFDALLFALLAWLAATGSRMRVSAWGLAVFVLAALPLLNFHYERLDLWLGGLLLLAVAALAGGAPWPAALALLGIAVNFKVVPAILIPLFAVGALPARLLRSGIRADARAIVTATLARGAFAVAAAVAVFVPFYAAWGARALDFIVYHGARGLQLESTYSSLLMALSWIGLPIQVSHGYGAFNLDAPMAAALAALSGPLVAVGCLLVVVLFLRTARTGTCTDKTTLAAANPDAFVLCAILTLVTGMAAAKVLSPQYLAWLVPLMPLVPVARPGGRVALGLFVAVCVATMPIYPYLYFSELVRASRLLADGSIAFARPTDTGIVLLLLRNALLVAMGVALFRTARRVRTT